MNEWQTKKAALQIGGVPVDDEQTQSITSQLNDEEAKLQKLRIQLARRNRDVSSLLRKLDDIPSRAELNQYQTRFFDLNTQSSLTLREHKQFFALYNTQTNKQACLTQEVNILNSIHDNYDKAMLSASMFSLSIL
jgi:hypothetical protein